MKWLIVGLAALLVRTATADDLPQPPCQTSPLPTYPASVGTSAVRSQVVAGWTPPACLAWEGPRPTLLVAIAGRLREPGGATALLARFGAVSRLPGLRYWSVTDQAWRVLITDAFAVSDAAGDGRRGDFRQEEMVPGVSLYSAERDSRSSGTVIYRMRVVVRSSDRIVVSIANATPMRALLLTLFAPGELQTTYFLDRLGPNEWGYYGMWGITTGLLTSGHAASSVNRAVALYRGFAGIPTDQEPPVAR